MPKKKRVLSKARREEILHQLGKAPVAINPDTAISPAQKSAQPKLAKSIDHTITLKHNRDTTKELKRVALAISLILVLMAAITVVNFKTDYLQTVGQTITQKIGF